MNKQLSSFECYYTQNQFNQLYVNDCPMFIVLKSDMFIVLNSRLPSSISVLNTLSNCNNNEKRSVADPDLELRGGGGGWRS